MIILVFIFIIIYYYLLSYKLFGDNYKMKQIYINYYKKLVTLKPNIVFKPSIKIIPLNIFQTWFTLDLTTNMKESVDTIKQLNPEFNYYLYDDAMCRQFIKDNFHKDVLNSYDSLIPGAYKADLWRYCILYTYGGIYLDIKFKPVNGFKFINLIDKEHFTMDQVSYNIRKTSWGLFNGYMVTLPNNPILLKCIETIVNNVKNKYYGDNYLHPTGPGLLGEIYFNYVNNLDNVDSVVSFNANIQINNQLLLNINKINMYFNIYIIYNNTRILENYSYYRKDQSQCIDNKIIPIHYIKLWKKHNIYK